MKRVYILLTAMALIVSTSCKKDKKESEKKVEEVTEEVEVTALLGRHLPLKLGQ